jgi:hypothetical protein
MIRVFRAALPVDSEDRETEAIAMRVSLEGPVETHDVARIAMPM